jgi:hypothetical protein
MSVCEGALFETITGDALLTDLDSSDPQDVLY